jgi:hypothetical protein
MAKKEEKEKEPEQKAKEPEAKAEGKKVVLLNRGKRHYDLPSGRVSPGETIEVSAEEAERFTNYKDLVDSSKLKMGGVRGAEAEKLKHQNDALTKENEDLKKQLAAK